jgi:predicted O-methyltransferase YrrM
MENLPMGMNPEGLIAELRQAQREVLQALQYSTDYLYRQLEAHAALVSWLQPVRPLPSFSGWAMSPDSQVFVGTTVLDTAPVSIVEFGAGASTVVVGYVLKRIGRGHLISVEHDEAFAVSVNQMIHDHDLKTAVHVVHAPLKEVAPGLPPWYDKGLLVRELPEQIDFVIVDGPPGNLGPSARYPALPFLIDRLAPGTTVVLHDAQREAEQKIIQRWEHEFHLTFRTIATATRLAVSQVLHVQTRRS